MSFVDVNVQIMPISELKAVIDTGMAELRTMFAGSQFSPSVQQAALGMLQRKFNSLLYKVEVGTAALIAGINQATEKALEELIDATPVSQSRILYYKGTHRNHGATKAAWHRAVWGSANNITYSFNNRYAFRVRTVEHGFSRPARHRMEPYPPDPSKMMGMAWQMSADEKKKVAYFLPALPRIEGLFFVAKTKGRLADELKNIDTKNKHSNVEAYSVAFGKEYSTI